MALPVILDLVKTTLPFLQRLSFPNGVNTYISDEVSRTQITLSTVDGWEYAGDVYSESSYTDSQRALIADYTCYHILLNESIRTVAGNSTEEGVSSQVTSAKADVVQVQFEPAKSEDGADLRLNTEQIMSVVKTRICTHSKQMGLSLALCDKGDEDVVKPFMFVC